MSKDLQLGFPCPHLVEERVALSEDRTTLRTQKPISGSGLLKVVANDTYVVSPSLGVQSSATLSSSKKQPYLVSPGLSDLTLRTQARTLVLNLPTGYLDTNRLVKLINDSVANPTERPYLVASNSNGVLVVKENLSFGRESQVRISGNAKEGLGFLDQVGSTGQVVLPPYRLFSVPTSAVIEGEDPGYFLRFDRPVRSNYYFTVSYLVSWNTCLRCRATEVENDMRFDDRGGTLVISNENLLYQSVLKILLTELKSNIYYPWYGSDITSSIGSKSNPSTANQIQQSIRTALSNLQSQQNQQTKYQIITPKERLYSVDHVGVRPSEKDPTVFLVDVVVRNYSFDPIEITIVYTAPGAYALPGTNRLRLGSFG